MIQTYKFWMKAKKKGGIEADAIFDFVEAKADAFLKEEVRKWVERYWPLVVDSPAHTYGYTRIDPKTYEPLT